MNIKDHPNLVKLLEDDEELSDLKAKSVDDILLRWLNFHLKAAGSDKRVKNFGDSVKDAEAYTIVLH